MRELTQIHKQRLRPYLPKLLARFREAARRGETDKPCPLCEACSCHCCECPVFTPLHPCDDYVPVSGIRVWASYRRIVPLVSGRDESAVRAWAKQVVAILAAVKAELEAEEAVA